jgi:hypothetical protein
MRSKPIKQRIAEMGTAWQAVMMALVSCAFWVASLPVAIALSGSDGGLAALFATVVVWLASAMGLLIGECCYGPSKSLSRLLAGMLVRMLIPLVACMAVLLTSQRLAAAGFEFYVLIFYLLALPIDTAIAVIKATTVNCT